MGYFLGLTPQHAKHFEEQERKAAKKLDATIGFAEITKRDLRQLAYKKAITVKQASKMIDGWNNLIAEKVREYAEDFGAF